MSNSIWGMWRAAFPQHTSPVTGRSFFPGHVLTPMRQQVWTVTVSSLLAGGQAQQLLWPGRPIGESPLLSGGASAF